MDRLLLKVANYLDEYRQLLNIHLVDFITEDLWYKSVPIDLEKCLLKTQDEWYELLNDIYTESENETKEKRKNIDDESLRNFIKIGKENSFDILEELANNENIHDDTNVRNDKDYTHWMNEKKSIEINSISRIVNKLSKDHCLRNIIDVGSGKGYLSSYLALKYNFNVLGIDSQIICSQSATKRNDKIKKSWKTKEDEIIGSFKCINHSVENSSPVMDLWFKMFPDIEPNNLLLIGLHTCGDLAVKMINIFFKNPELKVLVNVGCCYHLLEEEFSADNKDCTCIGFPLSKILRERKFILGRKSRMLASESLDRMIETKSTMNPTLFHRSLLQVLIRDKFKSLPDNPVGRIGKQCKNFHEYVRKSLTKLKLDNEKISNDEINEYLIKYEKYQHQMESLYRLRSILAPVIECLIIMDRYYYVKSSKNISKVYLKRLCSPLDSPRCYAIIAIK